MNDEIAFLPEDPEEPGTGVTEGWKILVVDDDMEIHHVTHLVLEGITFNDRSITMLSATSAGEARRVLAANPDIAVLLLDVVMETDDAGLALVPWLREELGLSALRIILRTGQPGQAPERDVVLRYDINDYRSKSELTAQKLLTATVAALRAYEALRALEDGQRNLELAVAERTRALQASEAHFRALIEAVPEGVVTIDSRGNIRTFSPAAEEIFGWKAAQAIGQSVNLLMTDRDALAHQGYLEDYRQSRHSSVIGAGPREVIGRRRNGAVFPMDLSINQAVIGGETLFVSTVRDTTERRREQEALRAAKDAAEQAARAKSEFLAMMSHEIRTPMNGILGMSQLLLDGELSEEERDYAQTIHQSGSALLTVLNDILDFSKLEAGRMDLELAPFDLAALVRATAALMDGKAREKGLGFAVRLAPDLPKWVQGDANRLRQVLLNLLSNALKFTEQGEIEVAVQRRNGAIYFAITDSGIGVPEDVRPMLFQHFIQADSSISRRFGGTGLGLAISRKIVLLMDGEIGVESVEGQGSTFWFTAALPLVDAQPHHLASTVPAHPGAAQIFARPGLPQAAVGAETPVMSTANRTALKVLLVEDNAVNRKVAMGLLDRLGHDALAAIDGQEAVALATAYSFDVILMDLHLPQMDGFQASSLIRQMDSHRDTTILALTGSVRADDLARCRTAGMDGHVIKPISLAGLQDALETVRPQGPAALGQATALNAQGEAEVIDENLFSALKDALGEAELVTILRLFANDADGLVERIESAIVGAQFETAMGLARDLRATAGSFGFMGLHQAAEAVLAQVPPRDARALGDALAALRPAIERAVAGLGQYFPQAFGQFGAERGRGGDRTDVAG
jgi:PAS domain S-box-containing protein